MPQTNSLVRGGIAIMAYCPDDGVLMTPICLDYHACYDCSECGTHWGYVDGTWAPESAENCPIHTECEVCLNRAESCRH